MGTDSKIEWTDASWNPVVGCSKVSPGCDNCYAERMAHRLAFMGKEGYAYVTTRKGHWNGKIYHVYPKRLEIPLHWREPRRIFVCSMGDLFHESVPFEFIDKVFDTMLSCKQHTFQLLTKRPERALEYYEGVQSDSNIMGEPAMIDHIDANHIWLGVTVEHPDYKNRIDTLRQIPASVRFLSIEPCLADLGELNLDGIGQVIVGGESGPGARPMHPDWVRSIRDQCQAASVPFFFKQWGAWGIAALQRGEKQLSLIGESIPLNPNTPFRCFPEHSNSTIPCAGWVRVGKKKAGCLLDGEEYNEYPKGVEE